MTNQDIQNHFTDPAFTNHLKNLTEADRSSFLADQLTMAGHGQTSGAYHKNAEGYNIKHPSQYWHFTVSYWQKYLVKNRREQKLPTYNRLRCPELILWLAEAAGLRQTYLDTAKDFLIAFDNSLPENTEKNGNYLYNSYESYNKFKQLCHISDITKIIKEADSWTEVKDKVAKL